LNKIPLIIGLGKTGISLAKYLAKSEETLYILESSPNNKYLKELKDLEIHCILNPEVSERNFKLISRIYPSPGVSMRHEAFQHAKNLNIPIQTDMDIYLKNSQSYNILVTGTNGKTTTVSMLEHLLQAFLKDKSISAIGNIGKPVLDFLDQKIDIAIIEVSSFQIEASSRLESEIGILLNVEEDHIDRHKSFETYKSLKLRVLQESNINISKLENKIIGKEFYDYENYFPESYILNNPTLNKWPIHDVFNLKASLLALKFILEEKENLEISDINDFLDKAIGIIASFKKQPHRFEVLGKVNDVIYINDSKATNFDATLKSIESSRNLNKEGNIYLICGGDLKEQGLSKKRAVIFKEIKKCFIYGKDKNIIKELLSNFTNCVSCDDLDSAYSLAKKKSQIGDLVLLSPACSSTDMFEDYRERGLRFKELVKQS
jgi:UDP-N-acetylmuramoylalanine--D-glutamate ligase